MNIIDLLYCKYVWCNLKIKKGNQIGFTNHLDTENLFILLVMPISAAVGIVIMELYKLNTEICMVVVIILALILNIWLQIYLKRKMRKTRIVFNKKYYNVVGVYFGQS